MCGANGVEAGLLIQKNAVGVTAEKIESAGVYKAPAKFLQRDGGQRKVALHQDASHVAQETHSSNARPLRERLAKLPDPLFARPLLDEHRVEHSGCVEKHDLLFVLRELRTDPGAAQISLEDGRRRCVSDDRDQIASLQSVHGQVPEPLPKLLRCLVQEELVFAPSNRRVARRLAGEVLHAKMLCSNPRVHKRQRAKTSRASGCENVPLFSGATPGSAQLRI